MMRGWPFGVDPRLFSKVEDPSGSVQLRYLGSAGLVVQAEQHTMVLDPYVTRHGFLRTVFGRLAPNTEAIRRHLPVADDVLVGHAHVDHILDAPDLCRMTGARFIGSPDACNVARAARLDESRIYETSGREEIACGPGRVRGLPSKHGKAIFGRVPFPGSISEIPPWPPRLHHLKHGLVLNWWVELGGIRIVHIDSAEYLDEELEGLGADIVCLCAVGRSYRPNYVRGVVELLRPRMIMACHWDLFFSPYEVPARRIPGVDLRGFMEEIRAEGVQPVLLPLDGRLGISP